LVFGTVSLGLVTLFPNFEDCNDSTGWKALKM